MAKLTVVIALPVLLVIGIPLVVWSYRTEASCLSGDCLHVDQARRHWMYVLPRIQWGLPDADEAAPVSDIAAAAAAFRDLSLRLTALTLADNVDRVSRASPSGPPNGFPDRNHVGGMQDSMSTGHDLKQ